VPGAKIGTPARIMTSATNRQKARILLIFAHFTNPRLAGTRLINVNHVHLAILFAAK